MKNIGGWGIYIYKYIRMTTGGSALYVLYKIPWSNPAGTAGVRGGIPLLSLMATSCRLAREFLLAASADQCFLPLGLWLELDEGRLIHRQGFLPLAVWLELGGRLIHRQGFLPLAVRLDLGGGLIHRQGFLADQGFLPLAVWLERGEGRLIHRQGFLANQGFLLGGHGGFTLIPYIIPYTPTKNTVQYRTKKKKNGKRGAKRWKKREKQ